MTVSTIALLKANWDEADPKQCFIDTLDTISDHGTGDHIWVNPEGSDSTGIGSFLNPYQTVTTAFAAVTAAQPTVFVMPGTYSEDLTWPARTNVRLIGVGKQGAVTISSGTACLKIYPATVLASFAGYIDNVNFAHTTGTGLFLDNSSCAGTFGLYLRDCKFTRTAGTSLFTNHGTNNPIFIEARDTEFGGQIYLQVKDKNDDFRLWNGKLARGLKSSNSASPALVGTAEISIFHSEVLHEGVSGGATNQKFNSVYSWSRTGSTIALVDTSDLAGSHTENIIGS